MDVARQSWYLPSVSGSGGLDCKDGLGFSCDKVVDGLVGELGETSWRGATSVGVFL